jgi:GH43 family beta-xylosidase
MSRSGRPAGGTLAFISALLVILAPGTGADAEPSRYTNPVVRQRADPWVYHHTDGWYYFTASVPEYDRIEIRRAGTIQGLGAASPVVIWRKHENGIMSANIWAPEIHFIDGAWYIYFAAARMSAPFDHSIYVLENTSADPLLGEWREKGQIVTSWSSFSLDATEFALRGAHYLVWAQKDPRIPGNSNLYIASMINPWTITGTQARISQPQYDWEKIGFRVNEGPAVLARNGRVFIAYSASATDAHYCMGMLTALEGADLLDPGSWSKSATPVFQTDPSAGVYGPGHNSFTTDGDLDVLVYHARSYRDIAGDPLYDPNRDTRAQVLGWNADGTPRFGTPQ